MYFGLWRWDLSLLKGYYLLSLLKLENRENLNKKFSESITHNSYWKIIKIFNATPI